MFVNSAFRGSFNNRLAVSSNIPIAIRIVILAIFFIASAFTERSDRDLRAVQVNLIIRQIGHRLLLQAGDSTSRVMPVTEIKEGTFLLTFENQFVFNHDSLMLLTQGLFPRTQFASGYTVTVHECKKAGIVYGFQIINTSTDILACKGRSQPAGCYTIEFAFPDLYENVEHRKADIDRPIESVKADPQGVNPIPPMAIGTHEIKSVKVDLQQANPNEFKTTTSDYPLSNLVNSGMLVLLGAGVTLLIGRFGKTLKPLPEQVQSHSILKESIQKLTALGKFLFDAKEQRLFPIAPIAIGGMENEVISLTDKECKILELLNKNFGELISRETLMQEVWINEGVITGRSLDMFVSKLRKKLSGDPELRITNVHGRGYKLEIIKSAYTLT